MTTIADSIGTQYFQLSTVGAGALAVGLQDVRQCIDLILRTIPGSDPLRPLFGCNAYRWTDKPIDIAIPNIKKDIYEGLELWEPRIEVTSITHEISGGSALEFFIGYRLIDDDISDSIVYSNSGTTTTAPSESGAVIISAIIPNKIENGIYRVSFIVNGQSVLPPTPPTGFLSTTDLLTWINANWGNYGRWYLTSGSLVLYLNSGMATKATLIVTQTAQITLKVFIPLLQPGQHYAIDFSVNGSSPQPQFPLDFFSDIEGLLFWITENWKTYGTWSIITQTAQAGSDGDFSGDFNEDFDSGNTVQADKYLVFQSDLISTATLKFN